VASEDIHERHINTAAQTPELEDDGEDELGDAEELDEDDMVGGTVSFLPATIAFWVGGNCRLMGDRSR
jgi:hypothetical protein